MSRYEELKTQASHLCSEISRAMDDMDGELSSPDLSEDEREKAEELIGLLDEAHSFAASCADTLGGLE